MFVKDFKHFIPTSLKQFYSNPRGPTCFPDFHTIHCTPHLFNLNSPHCTLFLYLLASMLSLHLFSTLINSSMCSFQIFFRSSTLTFTTSLSSLRQLTQHHLSSPQPFFGNSKQVTTITTQINLLHYLSRFLIHSRIYILFS